MDETCVEMRPLLGGLLDGELEPATVRRLDTHLAACPDCRAALETMRAQDRMLRRVADAEDEKADPIAEERALAGVLQRIREEPEAEWERAAAVADAARRPREAGRPRVWTARLRWISGLAVATAAVLLALRLSPYPLAPEAPRSVASKSTSGSETVVGGAVEVDRPDVASLEAEQKAEAPAPAPVSRIPVTPGMMRRMLASRPSADAPQEDRIAQQTAREGVGAAAPNVPPAALAQKTTDEGANAAAKNGGETGPDAAPSGAAAPESAAPVAGAGSLEETESARAEAVEPEGEDQASLQAPARGGKASEPAQEQETVRLYSEVQRDEKAARSARQRERRSAPSDLRGYTDALRRSLAAPSGQVQSFDSAREAPFPSLADTAATITDWRDRLDAAAVRLERDAEAGLPPEEEAPRWTILADLWEWLGRNENDPAAFARAVEAYQRALEVDAQAAGVDPDKLTRAVEGATVTSAPKE